MPRPDPCQTEACNIQKCLQAMNYQQDKCEHVLDQMRRCCDKFGAESICCEGFLKKQKSTNLKRPTQEKS